MDCPICFEPFSGEPDRKPLTLRCGHTFCYECIDHILQTPSRSCAKCRTKIAYSDTVQALPVNYALLEIIETMATAARTSAGGAAAVSPSSAAPASTLPRPPPAARPSPASASPSPSTSADAAASRAARTVEDVGCIVMLSPTFRTIENAIMGPLSPGEAGVVTAREGAGRSLRVLVRTHDDRSFAYPPRALVPFPRPGEVVTAQTATPGFRVRRGPDWEWSDQDDGGQGTIERPDTDAGWFKVVWDSGAWNNYRCGGAGTVTQHDLVFGSPVLLEPPGDARLALGARVMLSNLHLFCGDAHKGCLSGTDEGMIIANDGSAKPFQVRNAATGRSWWYEKLSLVTFPEPGDLVTPLVARPGLRVRKGPDFVEVAAVADAPSVTTWAAKGALQEATREGCFSVQWDDGVVSTHRIGAHGLFELIFSDPVVGLPHRAIMDGDEVMLARGFHQVPRAAAGPLRPGDKGEAVSRNASGWIQVRAAGGTTFFYPAEALVKYPRPGDLVTAENFLPGFQVRRGPAWQLGDQDGRGPGTILSCGSREPAAGCVRVQWVATHVTDAYPVSALVFSDPLEAAAAPRGRLSLGASVMLSRDYEGLGDAKDGPMRPGDSGVIVQEDGSSVPFRVRADRDGRSWWYPASALVFFPVPGDRVTSSNAQKGFLVVRGPDFRWGDDQDGGEGSIGTLLEPGAQEGWHEVRWSVTGVRNLYRVGHAECFDLVFASPVRSGSSDLGVRSIDSDEDDEVLNGAGERGRRPDSDSSSDYS